MAPISYAAVVARPRYSSPDPSSSSSLASGASSASSLSDVTSDINTPASSVGSSSPPMTPTRPTPGHIMFMPRDAAFRASGNKQGGCPGNHPVLVLRSHDQGSSNNDNEVDVLFLTSQPIVSRTTSKWWASNYVPIAPQIHPFRDAINLAPGCAGLQTASSVNVDTVYTVDWRTLVEYSGVGILHAGAPTLDPLGLEIVQAYAVNHQIDISTPWNQHGATCPAARRRASSDPLPSSASASPPSTFSFPRVAPKAAQEPPSKRFSHSPMGSVSAPAALAYVPNGSCHRPRPLRACDVSRNWRRPI